MWSAARTLPLGRSVDCFMRCSTALGLRGAGGTASAFSSTAASAADRGLRADMEPQYQSLQPVPQAQKLRLQLPEQPPSLAGAHTLPAAGAHAGGLLLRSRGPTPISEPVSLHHRDRAALAFTLGCRGSRTTCCHCAPLHRLHLSSRDMIDA